MLTVFRFWVKRLAEGLTLRLAEGLTLKLKGVDTVLSIDANGMPLSQDIFKGPRFTVRGER